MNYLLSGTPQTASNCVGGVLYDSGGPTGSYGVNENYHFLIKPWAHDGSEFVLSLEQLDLENIASTADFIIVSPDHAETHYYKIYHQSDKYKMDIVHDSALLSSSILTGSMSLPLDLMSFDVTSSGTRVISNTSSQVTIRFYSDSSVIATGFRLSWTAGCGTLTGAFFNNDWGSHDPGTRLYPGTVKEINSSSSDHGGYGEPVILRNALVQNNYDRGAINQLPYFFGHSGPATIRSRFTASITDLNSNYATGSIV